MKLEQLLAFQSVAELGSLGRASDHLHKTQPAISQSIKQLEEGLGVTLFSRSNYRLELTQSGRSLYQQTLRVLNEASSLQNMAKHLSAGNEASITLAMEASYDLRGIIPLLSNVQNQFPDTQIVLRQERLTGALGALSDRHATVCLSPSGPEHLLDTQFTTHYLSSGSLVNVASSQLLSRHPNLQTSAELINEYQIVIQDSGKYSGDKKWGIQDGQRCWYVNDFATKKMLIESGIGWGRLPQYQIQKSLNTGELF
ncbi:LysR family transcriptional regulator [Saccharophagus degradans]|uniref:LysR family transcriptional regulator n=2 Tax=Saccharophagus degradans TaxID=86304 RepID=A0AAW7X2S1_9GAMM|nr:LysR family transcriptional regulator [Saccharophagus degradans]MDO6421253.1 LysR family transcriptional regulator [Saccharophagus degradans]MDO6605836.1 LysR family transcriptional regulator [Saccharophagus degradans]